MVAVRKRWIARLRLWFVAYAALLTAEHLFGAANIIICVMVLVIMLMVGFSIKKYKSYYTPESAVALLVRVVVCARASVWSAALTRQCSLV